MINDGTRLTNFVTTLLFEGRPFKHSVILYSYRFNEAPDWVLDGEQNLIAYFQQVSDLAIGVEKVGLLECTFTEEEVYNSETRMIDGCQAWRVDYDLTLLISSKEGVLRFSATKDGREVASAKVVYAKDISVHD